MKAVLLALIGVASCAESNTVSKAESKVDLQKIIENELLQVDSDQRLSLEAREDAEIASHLKESMNLL